MQAIQEVFMTKEWVKDSRNEARVKTNLHTKTSKAWAQPSRRTRSSLRN